MLKQGTFIKNKYNKLLLCNLLTWATYGLNIMIDSLVGGNQLGETALTAVSIVSPLFGIVTSFSLLFTCGFSVMFGRAIGEFDNEHAYKLAFQSIVSAICISFVMVIVIYSIKIPFLNYYECTGELFKQASTYYNWTLVYMAIYPISMSIYYLVITDGDALFSMIGSTAEIVTNIVLSIVLCNKFGIVGLGVSTCAGAFICGLIYSLHFWRKTNSVRFKIGWSWKDTRESFVISFNRVMNSVFVSIVDVIMNKIVIVTCGIGMVPAYSVINLIFNLLLTNGAPYDSCIGFISTFIGEKNNYGIRNTIKLAKNSIIYINIVFTALFFFGSSFVPKIFGITTPEVVAEAVKACRIMAFTSVPFGFSIFGYFLYAALGKPSLSMLFATLNNLICPLVFSVPFAFLWRFTGVSVGMSLSAFLVIALFSLIVCAKYGKKDFPLYLTDYGEDVVGFDVCVENDNIISLRDAVTLELHNHGYDIENINLLIEELYLRISEKNPDKKILSECVLLFGEKQVRIIVRDNGTIFNFVDENNKVESINAHVLNSLLEQTKDKNYVLTTSFNRNGFVFEK